MVLIIFIITATIFVIVKLDMAVWTNYKNSEQTRQQAPQEQIEKRKVSFQGSFQRVPYDVEYTPEDDSIKVNLISIQTLGNPSKTQLKNEVAMHPNDILVYTSTDRDNQMIIAYLGSYPNGEAILKKFDTVDEAKDYVYKKTGREKVIINVIKVKTGD